MKQMPNNIFSISIDLTYKCNLRCLHCFNSSGEHNFQNQELSNEQLFKIVKDVAELNPTTVCFCGGETLLRKDILIKCAEYLNGYSNGDMSINLVTNGYLMTEEIAKDLKGAGIKFIQVSLDGSNKNSHEWIRNKEGAFDKAVNAIKLLKSTGFYVGVACTPTKKNINEIDEIIDLCKNLGVNEFRMQPLMKLGRAHSIENEFLDYIEYRKLARKLSHKNLLPEYKSINLEWGDPVMHIVDGRKGNKKLDYLCINAYGDLLVSPYLPIKFGNLKKRSLNEYFENGLSDIWKIEFLKLITKKINSCETLDINEINNQLPKIFTGQDIGFDLIEDNILLKNNEIIRIFNL